jgi:CRISPR/Cas system CMR-associated protein Cmr3 (group 5 of RAMP superfamily)
MIRCGTCGSGISAEEKHKILKVSKEEVIYRYYVCSRSRNRDCRELYINEQQLMDELSSVIDKVDLDLIGMRQLLETEIDKWYRVHKFLTGESLTDLQAQNKDYDLREYAKIIFKEGRIDEQRETLKHLKGRLILKNKKIYIDEVNETV